MSAVDRKHYQEWINYLIKNNIVHDVYTQGRSHKVKSGIGNCEFVNKNFSFKALGFMNKVKSHVMKNETYKTVRKSEWKKMKIINMGAGSEKEKWFNNCVEIDINKAYWMGALKVGAISQELYDEGIALGLSKVELLASIGSMAKTGRVRRFDGYKYGRSVILEDSEVTRHIWGAVSWEVDKVMQACCTALGEGFLFYWTDAVFFKKSSANIKIVNSTMAKFGFSGKIVALEYISRNEDGNIVVWTRSKMGHAQEDQVLRDVNGFYGRVFVYINNRKSMLSEIMESLGK